MTKPFKLIFKRNKSCRGWRTPVQCWYSFFILHVRNFLSNIIDFGLILLDCWQSFDVTPSDLDQKKMTYCTNHTIFKVYKMWLKIIIFQIFRWSIVTRVTFNASTCVKIIYAVGYIQIEVYSRSKFHIKEEKITNIVNLTKNTLCYLQFFVLHACWS